VSSIAHRDFVHLGMDVSKNAIAVAVLPPDRDRAEVDKIFHDADSVRRLIKRLGPPKRIWACYEAGPTGYDLQRLLNSMGVRCDVVAPSLIPKGSGDRVKTDRRDARRLTGLHRAGELTPVAIPTPAQEGVRDLCRTRGDMVQDLTRARNRLSGFLLRHSVVWRSGSPWTERHRRWLGTLSFDDPAVAITYAHYLATVQLRDTALESVETDLLPWCEKDPFGDQVARLAAYRGVTRIGALCLSAEVFDWRRFPKARPFMSFTGLVPGENSTGLTQRRGSITRAGNAHLRGQLTEAAWSYQHGPNVGVGIKERQAGVPPETVARSWAAQVRLCRRFRQLATHKNVRSVVAAAIARELAGFLWAEMVAQV
jgi:transposase